MLAGDLKGMHLAMSYCSIVLGQQITPHALATFTAEILSSRGPLPVGEIGKILQDTLGSQVGCCSFSLWLVVWEGGGK